MKRANPDEAIGDAIAKWATEGEAIMTNDSDTWAIDPHVQSRADTWIEKGRAIVHYVQGSVAWGNVSECGLQKGAVTTDWPKVTCESCRIARGGTMKRATPDEALGDAIARATPESLKALREALQRRGTAREQWQRAKSPLPFAEWARAEGLWGRE